MSKMTTQAQVRKSFWNTHLFVRYPGRPQNGYGATDRSAFVEYVDTLTKNGDITESLAQRVTL